MPGIYVLGIMQKLIRELNESKTALTTEYQRIKRKRGRKLFYWLIIAGLIAAFFLYATDVKSNNKAQTESVHQEFKSLRDEIRFELKKQNIDIDKKLQQQNDKIEGVKQAKAEKARLAAVEQSNRSKPVQRVRSFVGNCDTYRPLVAQYPWNVEVALAVMKAESGCRADATHRNSNGSVDHGLFQLNNIAVHDPAENIRIAYQVKYARSGWKPWVVCTKGIVKCI